MSNADRGKWAEKQAADWLEEMSKKHLGFAYHRFPDARAARGALQAQPADYLVAWKRDRREPIAAHLEVKETSLENRLPKDKITQHGKLRMFSEAGFKTIVLVYRSKFNDWLYLRGRELFYYDVLPPSFPFKDRPLFPTAAAALESAFA